MKNTIKIVLLIVVPIIILMILSVFIFRVSGVSTYFSEILYIATVINQYTGLNIWLSRLLALPILVIGYYFGVRDVLLHREKKIRGYIALGILWSITCVAMFTTEGSFSRTTGEALKYYFIDDTGQIVLREHSGVDSETGTKLQKVTPDIMRQYRSQQKGTLKVTDETIFDPKTGTPLKRYYQGTDGKITLFPLEVEFHPDYGTKLEIITQEIAIQYSKQKNIPLQPTPVLSISSPKPTPRPLPVHPLIKEIHEIPKLTIGLWSKFVVPALGSGVLGILPAGQWKVSVFVPEDPIGTNFKDGKPSQYRTLSELQFKVLAEGIPIESSTIVELSTDTVMTWKVNLKDSGLERDIETQALTLNIKVEEVFTQ